MAINVLRSFAQSMASDPTISRPLMNSVTVWDCYAFINESVEVFDLR